MPDDLRLFFKQTLTKPHQIVALAPSSAQLCAQMVAEIDPKGGKVVELGAGTGNITQAILATGLPATDLHCVEMNPAFCARLRARFPPAHIHEMSAGDLGDLGLSNVQCVVSGLPLLSMPIDLQRAIIKGSLALLGENGSFVQFTYGPKAPLAASLQREFALTARRSAKIWWNLPPARVYRFERASARVTQAAE